jgi:hypothetical protein
LPIWGDIAEVNGLVLKELIDIVIDKVADADERLIEIGSQFAADCRKQIQFIEIALKKSTK